MDRIATFNARHDVFFFFFFFGCVVLYLQIYWILEVWLHSPTHLTKVTRPITELRKWRWAVKRSASVTVSHWSLKACNMCNMVPTNQSTIFSNLLSRAPVGLLVDVAEYSKIISPSSRLSINPDWLLVGQVDRYNLLTDVAHRDYESSSGTATTRLPHGHT
ncbi:hypothetical protein F4811DRAFT_448365 [Daldinia bambusicola]|nr:hypothetical protein F4811DRAFT_448365 [Daldinia bambusicola]